eukprot:1162074-Pelagomonas_calceolata.AAC.8
MHNTCTHRMLDELHRAHDSLEESVQSSTAAGLSKLQGVEAQMTSMQESLSNDLKAGWKLGALKQGVSANDQHATVLEQELCSGAWASACVQGPWFSVILTRGCALWTTSPCVWWKVPLLPVRRNIGLALAVIAHCAYAYMV